ncbi:MAG: EutN/CcmL family microcompartment protein [Elusimicrobia bacterium]|nr:EutN/CcmL family microcompartment protein [Elusimicrobiota bacterium]
MIFARVVGNVVCTRKDEKLVGTKLLLVQPVNLEGAAQGTPLVAIDVVGSGEGELVLIVQGSSARQTRGTEGNPVDCTIFAVVDTIEKGRETIFSKRDDFTKK